MRARSCHSLRVPVERPAPRSGTASRRAQPFAGFHGDRETVPRRCQRAAPLRVERARRRVGEVEVDHEPCRRHLRDRRLSRCRARNDPLRTWCDRSSRRARGRRHLRRRRRSSARRECHRARRRSRADRGRTPHRFRSARSDAARVRAAPRPRPATPRRRGSTRGPSNAARSGTGLCSCDANRSSRRSRQTRCASLGSSPRCGAPPRRAR